MVDAEQGGAFTIYFANVVHAFRMPAFFVIAGYFTAMLLARRDPAKWFSGRALRLGIPFVVSLLTLVPLMNAVASAYMLAGFSSRELTSAYVTPGSTWVRHLWFLWVLLVLQGFAAMAVYLRPTLRTFHVASAMDTFVSNNLQKSLLIFAVFIGFYEVAVLGIYYKLQLDTPIIDGILRLGDLLYEAPFFIFGCILHRASMAKAQFLRPQVGLLIIVVMTLAVAAAATEMEHHFVARLLAPIAAIGVLQIGMSLSSVYLGVENALVRWLVDASFAIYLFHLPIVVWLAGAFRSVSLNYLVEFALVSVLTLAISCAAAWIVSKSAILSFLFSGVLPRAKAATVGKPQTV